MRFLDCHSAAMSLVLGLSPLVAEAEGLIAETNAINVQLAGPALHHRTRRRSGAVSQ